MAYVLKRIQDRPAPAGHNDGAMRAVGRDELLDAEDRRLGVGVVRRLVEHRVAVHVHAVREVLLAARLCYIVQQPSSWAMNSSRRTRSVSMSCSSTAAGALRHAPCAKNPVPL
eukprot:gene6658-biopygen8372